MSKYKVSYQGERTNDTGVDPFQGSSGCFSFGFPPVEGVFEFKERLADRVGEGHGRRIDEGDLADAPGLETKVAGQSGKGKGPE